MSKFTENLRFACAERHSVSQVCREIGLNRQQFNRYINGSTRPSAHNLARIARYFTLLPADFDNSPSVFRAKLENAQQRAGNKDRINEGFPGDIRALRRHLGYYQTYYLSPSWPSLVVCSCAVLEERNGLVTSKSIERIQNTQMNVKKITKYNGKVAHLRNRIFIVDSESTGAPIVTQSILYPFGDQRRVYLKGLCTGVACRQEDMPFATRIIWRYLGTHPDARAMIARCGAISPRSRQLPPTVKKFLLHQNSTQATLTLD